MQRACCGPNKASNLAQKADELNRLKEVHSELYQCSKATKPTGLVGVVMNTCVSTSGEVYYDASGTWLSYTLPLCGSLLEELVVEM